MLDDDEESEARISNTSIIYKYRKYPKFWRYINYVFLFLAILGIIFEIVYFAFYFWWSDFYFVMELIMIALNGSFILLRPETQKIWLKKIKWLVYGPFIITVILAIALLSLFGVVMTQQNVAKKHEYEKNFGIDLTLALLIPITPQLIQGVSYVLHSKSLYNFYF